VSRKHRERGRKHGHRHGPGPGPLGRAPSDADFDRAAKEFMQSHPDESAEIMSEIRDWQETFAREHGRQPDQADFEAWITEVLGDEEDEELLLEEDGLDEEEDEDEEDGEGNEECGDQDDMNLFLHRCAWCKRRIPRGSPVFSFGVKATVGTRMDADGPPLLLCTLSNGRKVIPLLVCGADSEAKRQTGSDLHVMVCSRECGAKAKKAIDAAVKPARGDGTN